MTHRIVLLLLILLTSRPALADWSIKRFKVVSGPIVEYSELLPEGADIVAYENEARGEEDRVAEVSVREVEQAFNEAAEWYRVQGFAEPALKTVVQTPEGPAYQVYLCKPREPSVVESVTSVLTPSPFNQCDPAAGSGFYVPVCNNEHSRNQHLFLNAAKVLDSSGKLKRGGYQTIAHELFHSIAANTPAMQSDPKCKVGKWISEGLADAVGYDLVYDLSVSASYNNGAYNAPEVWAGRFSPSTNDNAVGKEWGIRPYNLPLPHPNGKEHKEVLMPNSGAPVWPWYHSSSFWRYVAHSSGEGWRVLVTSRTGSGKGLLDIPLPSAFTGWQRDIYWLHEGLRGKFGRGVNMVYAGFVNDYVHRLPPISRFRDTTITEDQVRAWANMTFDTCKEVRLSNDRPSDVVDLELEALGARCVWVHPTNWPGTTQISFQAYSEDTSLLEDIIIGRPGAGLLSRANPVGRLPSGESNIALWPDYQQDGSKPALYIVSNVGKKHPTRSMPRKVSLWVSLPDNKVSNRSVPAALAGQPMDDPHPPRQTRQIPSLKRKQQETADMVAAQMERDKKTLNPNVRNASNLTRRAMVRECAEPFKYDPCGPQLGISLTLAPGTYIVPGTTSAQGGTAAQVFGGLQAMSQTSMGDQTANMKFLDDQLQRIDGSSVSIAIPMIDYGFAGSFDNASIIVEMAGRRKLSTFGPPDASGRTRLTGKVTIEEYSPVLLRGRFVAPLAEFLPSPGEDAPPPYVRRETVSGSFRLVAPWLADERVEKLQLDTQEEMAYDIANTLGISPDTVRDLEQQGVFSGQPGQSGTAPTGGGSASSIEPECTCECSMREHADELCELLCEEEFAACD